MANSTGYKRYYIDPDSGLRVYASKADQGIRTPKAPRRRKCGCWYREGEMITHCKDHHPEVISLPIRGERPKKADILKGLKEANA